MTCAEIKGHVIDYLYRELPAGERAVFEAHLGGCEACRGEVAALQGTLIQTRGAMKALEEAPPARVRTAVLEAARAALPVVAPVGGGASASLPGRRGPGRGNPTEQRAPEQAGWREWLRWPWLLPAGLAACAVAVLIVARDVITDPEATRTAMSESQAPPAAAPVVREAERSGSAATPGSVTPPVSQASAPPAKAGLARRDEQDQDQPAQRARRSAKPASISHRAPAPSDGFAQPPPPRPAPAIKRKVADDGLEGLLLGGGRQGDGRRDQSREGAAGASVGELRANRGPAEKKEARSEAAAADEAPRPVRERPMSPPVRPAMTPPPPTAAPQPAPPPAAAAPRPRPSEPMAEEPPEAEVSSLRDQEVAKARTEAKKGARSPFEELVWKADRLFTGGSWSEAARSYRELLRLYPEHKNAPVWKGRLRACEQALQR